jgi:exopolysaccharide biosynthesis predicted pyruvyltransferase EpsI
MPLLPDSEFAAVFEPLIGRRVGLVEPIGNVGDRLILLATQQLFQRFGVHWRTVTPEDATDVDVLVWGGGGNMGSLYMCNWDLRTRCLATGLPVVVFPQSFTTREDRPFQRVFVRERASQELHPQGILAPDLALGLDYQTNTRPTRARGVFLRRDCEAARRRWFRWRLKDPARMCHDPIEYLELAAQYQHIVTDRLHFAISGLILGRRTTLLGNSYHKNASLHATWLARLGCEFAMTERAAA